MSFDRIVGQEHDKAQIGAWLSAERMPHAVLVSGPEAVGKRHLAVELAKAVNCRRGSDPCDQCSSCLKIDSLSHPDFHTLLPLPSGSAKLDSAQVLTGLREAPLAYLQKEEPVLRNSNIAREHIRFIHREMSYAPTEARRRIAVAFDADCMHRAGANSLLKILEEPPKQAVFILVSAHPDRLLPTVLSRTQRLHLKPLTREKLTRQIMNEGVEAPRAELAARLSGGSLYRARELVEDRDGLFEERRQLVECFIEAGFNGEDGEYWPIAEEFGGRSERGRLEAFLRLCGVYLRDLFMLAEQRPDDLVNTDRSNRTAAWLEKIRPGRIESAALEVDRAFDDLSRNVDSKLILAGLWNGLRHCRRSSPAPSSSRSHP